MNFNARTSKMNFLGFASGSIASFSADSEYPLNIKNVITTQSPGLNGCNINKTGKNLLNTTWNNGYYISVDGTITAETNSCYSDLIYLPNGTYCFSAFSKGIGNKRIHGYDSSGNWVRQLNYASSTANNYFDVSFTITNDIKYIRISMAKLDNETQIEVGTTRTTYEIYNGNTYPISWETEVGAITSGTITINFDGTIDVTSNGTTTRLDSTIDIKSTIGINNVFSDIGDVNVHYLKLS